MKKISFLILVSALAAVFAVGCKQNAASGSKTDASYSGEKIDVDMYVMSKCPFGVKAVDAVLPAIEQLGGAAKLNIHFIGKTQGDTLSSMHGEPEVKGDKVQVCALKQDYSKALKMISCVNKTWRNIPDGYEACAKEAGLDDVAIKTCVEGKEGTDLLKASFAASDAKKASGSPTIYVNNKKYNGQRGTNDFLRGICDEFKANKPAVCANIPEAPVVNVTVLSDKRCKNCNADRIADQLKRGVFPKLEPKYVDYMSEEGKKLYDEIKDGSKLLPVILFDKDIDKVDGADRIVRYLDAVGGGKYKSLKVGAKFDPTAEICDNNVDDDANGKIDCEDDGCKGDFVCRKEIKNRLDVFVMSQCPYGVKALDAMKEVLEAFGNDIDFHVNYIANETAPGKFRSLHGQPEVDENIRELCAIKHYPKNYKYMDYVLCRNKNIRDANWQSCAVNGIDAKVIEKCSTGEEGVKLLSENIKNANELGIGASPTWVANNKFKFSGIAADAIKTSFCQNNPGKKGCEKKLNDKSNVPSGAGCGS